MDEKPELSAKLNFGRWYRNNRQKVKSIACTAVALVGLYAANKIPAVNKATTYCADVANYAILGDWKLYTFQKGDSLDKIIKLTGVPNSKFRAVKDATGVVNDIFGNNYPNFNPDKIKAGQAVEILDYNHNYTWISNKKDK